MSILFHLAFTGSVLGNVLAIYLLLRERTVAAGTADELATALRACWARAEIERLAELLQAEIDQVEEADIYSEGGSL